MASHDTKKYHKIFKVVLRNPNLEVRFADHGWRYHDRRPPSRSCPPVKYYTAERVGEELELAAQVRVWGRGGGRGAADTCFRKATGT